MCSVYDQAYGRLAAARSRPVDDSCASILRDGPLALLRIPAVIASAHPTEGWVENGVLSTESFVANCKTVLDFVAFAPAKSSPSSPKAPTP